MHGMRLHDRVPRHGDIRLETTLRSTDTSAHLALLLESERGVERDRPPVRCARDQLHAQNLGMGGPHLIEQRFEQTPADTAALGDRIDGDREIREDVRTCENEAVLGVDRKQFYAGVLGTGSMNAHRRGRARR